MKGWVHLVGPALETDADLADWVAVGADYARSLPPK